MFVYIILDTCLVGCEISHWLIPVIPHRQVEKLTAEMRAKSPGSRSWQVMAGEGSEHLGVFGVEYIAMNMNMCVISCIPECIGLYIYILGSAILQAA